MDEKPDNCEAFITNYTFFVVKIVLRTKSFNKTFLVVKHITRTNRYAVRLSKIFFTVLAFFAEIFEPMDGKKLNLLFLFSGEHLIYFNIR